MVQSLILAKKMYGGTGKTPTLNFLLYCIALISLAGCGHGPDSSKIPPAPSDPALSFLIMHMIPHDSASFTEGLELHDSVLYESAGNYGASSLSAYRLNDGKLLARKPLAKEYFGEGITVLGDRLYQLTYKEHAVFVYHYPDLATLKTGYWARQGWGLTNDGTSLIADDGSDKLYFLDPATLRETRRISVTGAQGPVPDLNELEYVDGQLFANRWHTNQIYRIDPRTGKVTGVADLGALFAQMGLTFQPKDPAEDVLNGIAYDKGTKTFVVTGKHWPKAFFLRIF